MTRKPLAVLLPLAVVTLACNALGGFFESDTATPIPLPTILPTNLDPAYQPGGVTAIPTILLSPTFEPTPALPPPGPPEESLLILSPGPLSQITSPVTVFGISNPTFENTLSVQILGEDGTELGRGFANITAELGQPGPFEGLVEFTPPSQPQPGTLVISDLSARDGHIVHLSSVPVTLLPAGSTADIRPGVEHPEDIIIDSPALSQVISGGVVHVSGFSAPFFEQTLVVLVLDQNSLTVGNAVLTIQSEAGQPGLFAIDVPYTVSSEQPGAVQVFATSPRDGSFVHLSAVEVTLQP